MIPSIRDEYMCSHTSLIYVAVFALQCACIEQLTHWVYSVE